MVANKHIYKQWLFLLGLIIAPLVLIASATAQDDNQAGNGLRITPVRQELILAPGQQDSYEIEITNVSSGDMESVVAILNDFESDNETGQPRLLVRDDQSSPFSLKDYVTLPEPFSLKAGESRSVTVGVNLPTDVSPGGYFGAVRFAPSTLGNIDEGNVALTASVGSILLVSVPGDVPEGMTLEKIEARRGGSSSTFFETAPDIAAATLKNTGNTILKPFGQVIVKDIFGNEVHRYEFNGGQLRGNVLPQSSRTFEDPIENISWIGRYTIEANLSFGEGGGTILQGKTTFWVIPWKILLVVIALIAAVVWVATKGVKTYNRKIVERAKRNS